MLEKINKNVSEENIKNQTKKTKVIKQNFDLNLYHIYETIISCKPYLFDDNIKKELNKLLKFIEKKLFLDIPHNYDICDTKCVYYLYLEQEN